MKEQKKIDCAVKIIITGYERGGTTLLSDLFRSNGYQSGFECGILLSDSPKNFKKHEPYYEMLLAGWGINKKQRNLLIGSKSFEEFYNRLTAFSFPDEEGTNFFDKTPAYMQSLGLVLQRAPFVEKVVVIYRDPRSVFQSWARRLDSAGSMEETISKNLIGWSRRYVSYFVGCVAHFGNPKVLFVPFEGLAVNSEQWSSIVGNFIDGRPFENAVLKPRFKNVDGSRIDFSRGFEHRSLSVGLQYRILEATKLASPFFCADGVEEGHIQFWRDYRDKLQRRLKKYELPQIGVEVAGEYFEPLTYLLRYDDILKSGVNPVEHYRDCGVRENRKPC